MMLQIVEEVAGTVCGTGFAVFSPPVHPPAQQVHPQAQQDGMFCRVGKIWSLKYTLVVLARVLEATTKNVVRKTVHPQTKSWLRLYVDNTMSDI